MLHIVRWIYAFTVLIFFTVSCTREIEDTPDDTVIQGTIRFKHGSKIYLFGFKDSLNRYLGGKSVLDTATIGEDGSFRFVFHPSGSNIYDLRLPDTALIKDMYINPKASLTTILSIP